MRKPNCPNVTTAEVAHWRALRNAGLSYREIGRQVGRSRETIRARLDPLAIYRQAEAREAARQAEAAADA